jgi:hypothetical protein
LVASLQEANFVNGLIVIDTLNQASPGVDENSVKEISQVLNHLKFIQRETNSLTLIVHHSGKDVNRGLRGSSSIRAALDTSIEVSSESYTQKEWRIEKSKDAADGKTYKYSLKEITLGQDKDQSPITSCVVEPGEKTLYSKPKPTGKNQKTAYSKIEFLLSISVILGKCFQMPDTKMIEVEDAVEEISKAFTTTEQSKRRNQARTALQSLISNVPTIIYYNHEQNYLAKNYKNFYLNLLKANILHKNGHAAAKFINKLVNDDAIHKWWTSKATQNARKSFLKKNLNKQIKNLKI